jgi:threonine/homoserine/homoserine lactone efflux protein
MVAGVESIVSLLLRGLGCGVIIAAPVGPVNVICVQRTITRGWRAGVISGFGSAAADTIYGAIAAFSISFVIEFLLREEYWIRLFGGIIRIGIAALYLTRRPHRMGEEIQKSEHSDWVSTFLLTLTNPTTVLSYLAVLAALRLAEQRSPLLTLLLVGAIFTGTMFWWVTLTGIVNRFRDRFTDNTLCWVHRIGGIAIGLFGVVTLVLSKRPPR